jgi:membrane associated rhomboid family serine protease
MLPIRDVIPSRTTPGITLLLIALNVLVFVVTFAAPNASAHALVPVPTPDAGLTGHLDRWLTETISLFRHGSLVHLTGNLAALWLFGENVEDRFGHLRFLLCYLVLGYGTALADFWLVPSPAAPLSGATGAIAGIAAAYLVMFPRSRLLSILPTGVPPTLIELPAAAVAAAWFLLQVARGTGPLTLFVGAAGGALAVWLLRRPERQRVEWWAE